MLPVKKRGVLGRFIQILMTLCLLLGLIGCAAMQEHDTLQNERSLAAAGFQMRLADTPKKLAQLQALPQRKLIPREKDGQTYFMYADAEDCKCLYVGTDRAYQSYERLATEERIQQERVEAAADWDLEAWGPWAPWW